MSELGESAELIDELIMESSSLDGAHGGAPRWHKQVALSTLVLALLTAVGALLAGMTAHEALIERTEEVIAVSIMEGDRVSVDVLQAKHEILASLGEPVDGAEIAQIQAYEKEIEKLAEDAGREEETSLAASSAHLILAIAVTVLSVGITLCGMAIVIELKSLWFAGMATGLVGAICLGIGLVTMLT